MLQESHTATPETNTTAYTHFHTLPQEDILNIFLVEDVRSDALLTRIALDSTDIPFLLTKVTRGDEALSRLCVNRVCRPAELPDLILLDLELPGMDGFEILEELAKSAASLRSIPIVILTAHRQFEYIRSCYPLYVMSYIKKPCDRAQMREILQKVCRLKYGSYATY
ncbi:MAG TPA: response regulator [Rickettsiales bacterium]|nr:response regulator [Rickettsiales bacterium]